jgi:hypothetical protein
VRCRCGSAEVGKCVFYRRLLTTGACGQGPGQVREDEVGETVSKPKPESLSERRAEAVEYGGLSPTHATSLSTCRVAQHVPQRHYCSSGSVQVI